MKKNIDTIHNDIDTKICELINLEGNNKYLCETGRFLDSTSQNFKIKEIDVCENERYYISGNVIDLQRLYAFIGATGEVIEIFPDTQDNLALTYHEKVVKIPKGVSKLRVCSYINFDKNIVKLPILNTTNTSEKLNYTYLLNKVMFIGDSLTMGAYYKPGNNGRSIKESYPYYFSKINRCEILNEGESGLTAKEWWEARGSNIVGDYDTFIVWLGTNGGLTNTLETDYNNLDTNVGCYCAIIDKIKTVRPNANIFLLNIFASSGDLEETNIVLEKIATKYNLPLFNMNDGSIYHSYNHDILHPFNNGIHFGKIGNLTVAKKVTSYINEYVAKNPSQFEEIYLS